MNYILEIRRDGAMLISMEIDAHRVIELLTFAPKEAVLEKRAYKKRKTKNTGATDAELMLNAARRHPQTEEIEKMLIEGLSAPAIMEKIEVSPPTIYVIKNRLKKEGRLQ